MGSKRDIYYFKCDDKTWLGEMLPCTWDMESLLSGIYNKTIHLHKHVYPNIHMLHVHVNIALSNINSSVEIMPAVDQTKQTEKRPYSTESPILHYKNIDVHFPACKCL